MSKIYPKWRENEIDINEIDFKIDKIISYPPAGNDVYEILSDKKNLFLKVERSKMADFEAEKNNIDLIKKYYNKIPDIIKFGKIKDKHYIILSKIEGERVSDLINENKINILDAYKKYGKELAKIHKIKPSEFNIAKQRVINDIIPDDRYKERDEFITSIIKYLKENHPIINYDTFIHGDFHYANILWKNNKISGVIDFEYSGKGFKEQDIAWALIYRSSQIFDFGIDEIKSFLNGYSEINNFDYELFKWCYLNGCVHFYLMNNDNTEYKNKLRSLMEKI